MSTETADKGIELLAGLRYMDISSDIELGKDRFFAAFLGWHDPAAVDPAHELNPIDTADYDDHFAQPAGTRVTQ